jgi:hypothetical protein
MAENNIENSDKDYLDEAFIRKINNSEINSLLSLMKELLENYRTELNYEQFQYFNNECKSLYDEGYSENFIRQLKYLINKGIYNRITKRYKSDLIELGIEPEKVEAISNLQKQYQDINLDKNEKNVKNNSLYLKDFDMYTEMPVHYSDYKISKEEQENYDIKKQNLILNLNLSNGEKEEHKIFEIDKLKMINLFEKVEQIQEYLDKIS